jgi:hypothetical protein
MGVVSLAQSTNGPYKDEATNLIYQLLFCDRLALFKDHHTGKIEPPWSTLFHKNPDLASLTRIAQDKQRESRVRMLAFNILRTAGQPVPKGEYLGTIIEVHLEDGLDTLAVFADGRARYINYTGKMAIVEGTPSPFDDEIRGVIETSKPIVAAIGPWEKERLPPPKQGNIRTTFLVSDGLYFGEGPMSAIQRDRLAGPLISASTKLLLKIVDASIVK